MQDIYTCIFYAHTHQAKVKYKAMRGKDESAVCARYDKIASDLANQVRRKRRVDMNKKLEHVKKERDILHMRPLRQHRERFGESGTWSVVARYDNVASKLAN